MIPKSAEKYIYHEEPGIVLLHGDCRDILPQLKPESIQCCVTSPPYWGLRDYGKDDQIGLECSPEKYVSELDEIFSHVNKLLKTDGTLWLNLGDSYAHPNTGGNGATGGRDKSTLQSKMPPVNTTPVKKNMPKNLKPKDLIGIPWRVAFALQAAGWYLRSDIIWHKPNPMPESVTDRPTKTHEYLFLMSKSAKYYYDHEAIKEPQQEYERNRRLKEQAKGLDRKYDIASEGKTGQQPQSESGAVKSLKRRHELAVEGTRNKRSVWTVATKPYPGAHFAVFPPELIEPCILAGTKEGDIVIDPFNGSGTVGHVCKKHKRRYIGIELNKEYLKLNPDRIGAQGVLI